MSLHRRIHDDMSSRITSGALKPGDRLPTEAELMQAYGCSRMTAYKALSQLQAAGLIERRRKAGSFVAAPQLSSTVLEIPDLQAQTEARGETYQFRLLLQRVRGRELEVSGVHVCAGRPLCVETRTIHLDAVPEALTINFAHISPGRWLLQQVRWTQAENRISAIVADGEISRLLEITRGSACLRVERETWRDGEAVTAVRQVFDGAHYHLVAKF